MRRRIVLRGRVQGVGFRYTVLGRAQRHSVAGTVRNLRDSAVEIDVEGEAAAIDEFVADVLENVPIAARVDNVNSEERAPVGMEGFKVLPSG